MNNYVVECCSNSIKSALQGILGGANRIEFCSNIETGGITPSREDISLLIKKIDIPLRVLIRPRSGNFIYSEKEILKMISDIKFCKSIGCEGVVIGALTKNRNINIKTTKRLIKAARPMHVTFHRAFDEGNNLNQNLEDVIASGCDTLLTSGQKKNVKRGLNNLKVLIKLANNRITILSGGGVNYKNAQDLYKVGVRNFHLSGNIKNKKGALESSALLIKFLVKKLDEII